MLCGPIYDRYIKISQGKYKRLQNYSVPHLNTAWEEQKRWQRNSRKHVDSPHLRIVSQSSETFWCEEFVLNIQKQRCNMKMR